MKRLFDSIVCALLICCVLAHGVPRPSAASTSLARGAGDANSAARLPGSEPADKRMRVLRAARAGEPVLSMGAVLAAAYANAEPDSAAAEPDPEFEFPEDEGNNLVRDISIFLIVSAFTAFFIVKVFIEEDDPEPEEEDGGKTIP